MSFTHLPRKKLSLLMMTASSLLLVGGMIWFIQSITVKANFPDISSAETRYPNIVNSRIDTCSLCHLGSPPNLNPYGAAYKAAGRNSAALAAIEPLDSDGDGWTNLREIMALTFPGDTNDHPAGATATSVPPTATKTAMPPTATRTSTNPPPTATKTAVPPTPTKTATNPPPTATRTIAPPTATSTVVLPTRTNTPPPPPTSTIPAPPQPTTTHTAPPPPTATHTPPPPPTATMTVPPPPTATNTVPPLPTSTKMATSTPTRTFMPTATLIVGSTRQPTQAPTDDEHENPHATPTRHPIPTRRPSPTPPCGYYREDDVNQSPGWTSNFSHAEGDRGAIYRRCNPHDNDDNNFLNQFAAQVNNFFSWIFRGFR